MLNKIAKHQIENINQMNTQVVEKTTKITEQDNNVRELYIMTPEMVDAIRSKVEKNSKMPAMELEIEDLKLAHEFRRLFERPSTSVAASVNTMIESPTHSQTMVSMTGEQEGPSELQMEFDIAPPSNTPINIVGPSTRNIGSADVSRIGDSISEYGRKFDKAVAAAANKFHLTPRYINIACNGMTPESSYKYFESCGIANTQWLGIKLAGYWKSGLNRRELIKLGVPINKLTKRVDLSGLLNLVYYGGLRSALFVDELLKNGLDEVISNSVMYNRLVSDESSYEKKFNDIRNPSAMKKSHGFCFSKMLSSRSKTSSVRAKNRMIREIYKEIEYCKAHGISGFMRDGVSGRTHLELSEEQKLAAVNEVMQNPPSL